MGEMRQVWPSDLRHDAAGSRSSTAGKELIWLNRLKELRFLVRARYTTLLDRSPPDN